MAAKSKQKPGESQFAKACMKCQSFNIKVFSGDDNNVFGLNPKYQCMDCGSVGMPIELPIQVKK